MAMYGTIINYGYTHGNDGESSALAASSCGALKAIGKSSGTYYIKPDKYTGSAFQVYCDMSSGDGLGMAVLENANRIDQLNTTGDNGIPNATTTYGKLSDTKINAILEASFTRASRVNSGGGGDSDKMANVYIRCTQYAWVRISGGWVGGSNPISTCIGAWNGSVYVGCSQYNGVHYYGFVFIDTGNERDHVLHIHEGTYGGSHKPCRPHNGTDTELTVWSK